MNGLGFKHFRQDGCLSYFVYDQATREAAVIDPNAELMADYREFIAEERLKPTWVFDTHTHADHFSGTHLFRAEYGSEIGMSRHTRSERVTRRLGQRESIKLGSIEILAIDTPGHTPDSVSFLALRGELGAVFTGDTLFIGSSGRTDFPGADPGHQWDSLHQALGGLPGSTLLYPGHDYNDLLFSTLETEKNHNPHWKKAREEFVAFKKAELMPNANAEIQRRIEYNLAAKPLSEPVRGVGAATACGSASGAPDRSASINIEKFRHKLDEKLEGVCFVDVREPYEYREGHMPGAENIPLSELGLRLPELARAKRVYVSCLSGFRSSMAARTLSYLGLADVVNVSGGFKAWVKAGYRTEPPA